MIAVFRIIKGDGTLASMGERQKEGLYESNSLYEVVTRLENAYGIAIKNEYDALKESVIMTYASYSFYVLRISSE